MDVFASATTQLEALRSGEASARELVDAQLARAEKLNGDLNAIVWMHPDGARAAARAIEGGPTAERPLLGLPMTVKEAFNLAGAPTTWGVPLFKDNVPGEDSVVVERLRRAGAIVFGKTNVPLMLGDLQSYNEIYGTTNNPWDRTRTPGGSSGGSAAALAAGMTALEMGSDIGGSIRNPAHYCGVFGHKPTWSLIPSRGHALPGALAEPDIAVVGPLARSARDLDLALDVVAHPDRLQAGVRYDLTAFPGARGLRVALWPNDPVAPVARAVEERVRAVGRAFADLGATVVEDARPAFESAHGLRVYGALLQSFLGAFNPDPVYDDLKQKAAALDPADTSDAADLIRAQTLSHRDWVRFHEAREGLRWAWRTFFDAHDVVVMPICATPAFPQDEGPMAARRLQVDGAEQTHYQQIFWAGLTGIAHLPSTVVPTGPDADGLPIGVQIVGPAYGDRITIGAARALEEAGFRFQPPPGY
jgi:amidase